MSISRRKFIKTAAAASLFSTSGILGACASGKKGIGDFGLQLYTLRDVLPADPASVIRAVAEMGYKQVESFEGPQGFFWGMTNVEFKKLMDETGMKIVSSHTDIRKDFEMKAGQAAEIGMNYLIDPWEGPQESIDDFKRIADLFNEKGEVCKRNGIRFGYHNHDYSFVTIDGQVPQDVLMENTDPELVDFEMDIYWVVTAGQNPLEWFKKYPGRWKLGHVKDREKGTPLSEKDVSVVLGTGSIDWPKILKAGMDQGMQYCIAEQERHVDMTSEEAARQGAEYLKGLKI